MATCALPPVLNSRHWYVIRTNKLHVLIILYEEKYWPQYIYSLLSCIVQKFNSIISQSYSAFTLIQYPKSLASVMGTGTDTLFGLPLLWLSLLHGFLIPEQLSHLCGALWLCRLLHWMLPLPGAGEWLFSYGGMSLLNPQQYTIKNPAYSLS